uniref:Uncharacterized protein n=1 Tax=Candidatus Kentrum sp. LFY TaxID=2126342 RepID=A0A450USG1_9GAMM|nr:MAG: hypothetical protein BECKLFY1418A_GA0070994_10515 [Candidatus Kentron sp. LFY]
MVKNLQASCNRDRYAAGYDITLVYYRNIMFNYDPFGVCNVPRAPAGRINKSPRANESLREPYFSQGIRLSCYFQLIFAFHSLS